MNYQILIVDDSPLLRATAKRAVLQAGALLENVREAGNGQEALASLQAKPADIVLLDINMPVMDGYQFVEAKQKDASLSEVRVALVTTEGNRERLSRMTALGVEHYLRKPFEPEELRDLVKDMFQTT
ncbi:MAG: response regulator [Planctomycetota bacterium]